MKSTLITNARIINEGENFIGSLLIEGERIAKISKDNIACNPDTTIDAKGKLLLPGLIDDQVHFREPGMTYKADIYTESKAAVAGGITSFMEMPNTIPNTVKQNILKDKYDIAAETSLANYSFYFGATNDNLDEVLKTNPKNVCGIKVFMGSSTGNMLVDNTKTLEGLFSECKLLIASHCEYEPIIRKNTETYRKQYGENLPMKYHPMIRSEEACYRSSSIAAELATKHDARLHILHISTAKETSIFSNDTPLTEKKVTAEACIHHMWFSDEDYDKKGTFIKWNPAVKTSKDREAIIEAVNNGTIDVIATDHAPHTLEEKNNPYFSAPSGGPLVQHALVALLEMVKLGKLTLEHVVQKTSHDVAALFEIKDRGYLREGYFADLVLVDFDNEWQVKKDNILYKCGWSPFEGTTFKSKVTTTFVNGNPVYENGMFDESSKGQRMLFNR
ncbi:MAG: dihydroorotase [Flavobacteriales bacterium]|nr:dihydroorotase [Flavobacteriales bacterium]